MIQKVISVDRVLLVWDRHQDFIHRDALDKLNQDQEVTNGKCLIRSYISNKRRDRMETVGIPLSTRHLKALDYGC